MPEETEDTREDFDIIRPNLILCEGSADKNFLERLLDAHGIADYQVTFPEGGGINKFREFLSPLPMNRGFTELSSIVLVSDNDTACRDPLHRLKQEVREARAGYPIPNEPLAPARKVGYPAMVAAFLPWHDRRGNLETLLLDAFSEEWPDKKLEAENFVNTHTAGDWNDDEKAQAILQTMIAVTCKKEAACSLAYLWSKQPFRELIRSSAFAQLAEFLRDLPSSL